MESKDAYEQKMEAQLHEWKAEIEKLKAKANKATADAKIEYSRQIEDLQEKRKAAESKLGDIKKQTSGAWEELRSGMEKAMDDLGNSVKKALDTSNV